MDDHAMSHLKHIKALLIDLNGTIHVGNDPTSRAVEAVDKLRRARIPFIFCSNNTKESTDDVVHRLSGLGLSVKNEEVMTSLGACRQLVNSKKLRPYLMLSPSAQKDFSHLPPSRPEQCDSVIIGLHEPSLSYASLNIAFRILKGEPLSCSADTTTTSRSRPVLIAPHTASFMQSSATSDLPEGLSLGIGPFVKALESATGAEAEIVGKPTKRFFELAIERLKGLYPDCEVDMGDIGVVGDDIENDLGSGTLGLGLKRILVKTGKYRPGAEDSTDRPDAIFDTFADFIQKIL